MIRLLINSLQPMAYGNLKFPIVACCNGKTPEKLNFPMRTLREGHNSEAGVHILSHKTSITLH
jgi:hypothetical protein